MKIQILLICGVAMLCGCNKQTDDSVKIEALSQKLDLIAKNQSITISNEFVLFNQIQAVKNQMTNVLTFSQVNSLDYYYYTNSPNLKQIDSMLYYYHTNEMDKFDRQDSYQTAMNNIFWSEDQIIVSNTIDLLDPKSNPENPTDSIEWMQMQDDIFDMNTKVDDMQEDLLKIKTRLGILY